MKKVIIIVLIVLLLGGAAWFFLLRPEQVTRENLTQDFESQRKSYEDVAIYLQTKHITTELTDIPMAGETYPGIVYEDSDAYRAFMEGWMQLMCEDHEAIRSDGHTVTFVYESTGGLLVRKKGYVIYCDSHEVNGTDRLRLANDWDLYITK